MSFLHSLTLAHDVVCIVRITSNFHSSDLTFGYIPRLHTRVSPHHTTPTLDFASVETAALAMARPHARALSQNPQPRPPSESLNANGNALHWADCMPRPETCRAQPRQLQQ